MKKFVMLGALLAFLVCGGMSALEVRAWKQADERHSEAFAAAARAAILEGAEDFQTSNRLARAIEDHKSAARGWAALAVVLPAVALGGYWAGSRRRA